jgi:hypothetical protein
VAGEGWLHCRWVCLRELGGAFYVCKQKGESACGRASGHDTSMSSLLPLRGHYSSGAFPGSSVRASAKVRVHRLLQNRLILCVASCVRGLPMGLEPAALGATICRHPFLRVAA